MMAENYPRGHKELRGAFFNVHGPVDTMSWFSEHGVRLKVGTKLHVSFFKHVFIVHV